MIRVITVTTYRATDSEVIEIESFRDKKYTKGTYLRQWVEWLQLEKEKVHGFPVKCYAMRRTMSDEVKDIDMMGLLHNTAKVMGENIDEVLDKTTDGKYSRKRRYVDVRKVAVMILFDMDFDAMDIERGLPFKDRVVYDYRTKMEDRFITEPGFIKAYEDISKEVLKLTLNGLDYETQDKELRDTDI